MTIFTSLGLGLLLLGTPGAEAQIAPRAQLAMSGPRAPFVARTALPLTRPVLAPSVTKDVVRCILWYYPGPGPLVFSKSANVTETFYVAGADSELSQYDGHPEWVHLEDSLVSSANPWTVTAASWDGTWLRIEATHGEVTEGLAVSAAAKASAQGLPPVPSKVLPTAARASANVTSDVGGALTITLDPIGANHCKTQWLPVVYVPSVVTAQ